MDDIKEGLVLLPNSGKPNLLTLSTSEVARALLSFKGNKFSLDGYKPFEAIYNVDPPLCTVKTSRQSGKSVSIGAILVAKSVARPFFNSLFVSPLSIQTSRFSKLYLQPFADSPLVKKYFKKYGDTANIFMKSFSNGSIIFLSYAETEEDADRIRGIAADSVFIDEAADLAYDSLPIIYEVLAASPYAYKKHTGTPKSSSNTLEVLFNKGSGSEWAMKCAHCNNWNIPNTIENCLAMCVSEEGPVCLFCGKPIDIEAGTWVAARPQEKDHLSFHIPRHVLKARTDPKKWRDLQLSIKNYAPAKVANEVFGIASGIGGRILSEAECMLCSNSERKAFDTGWPRDGRGIVTVVLGIDWAVSLSVKSYTVMTVLGFDYTGKCYVLYTERINGTDILAQVSHAEYLFMKFGCQRLHADRGVGVLQGQLLQKSLGMDRVTMVQYSSAKVPLRYDRVGGYLSADRTTIMDTAILKMKLGPTKFETPCWDLMSGFWVDCLSVYEEETLAGKRVYRHDEYSPDDFLHSVVFGLTAYMVHNGDYQYVEVAD